MGILCHVPSALFMRDSRCTNGKTSVLYGWIQLRSVRGTRAHTAWRSLTKRRVSQFLYLPDAVLCQKHYLNVYIAVLNGSIMKQRKFGSPNRLTTKKSGLNRVALPTPDITQGKNNKGQIKLILTVSPLIYSDITQGKNNGSFRPFGGANRLASQSNLLMFGVR